MSLDKTPTQSSLSPWSSWLDSITHNSIYLTFPAQNHIYGCLSLLEQIEEGDVILEDLSAEPVIVFKDLSGEFQTLGLNTHFGNIGTVFGFTGDDHDAFLEWDEGNRNGWIDIFRYFSEQQENNSKEQSVEDLEAWFYNFYKSHFDSKPCAFTAIMNGQEITDDMREISSLGKSERQNQEGENKSDTAGTGTQKTTSNLFEKSEIHHSRKRTYRARRNTTPLYRRRGFNNTRKSGLKN